MSADTLVMVTAPTLLKAVEGVEDGAQRTLKNGVPVTGAQLRKAAAILADGPQPVCNGLRDDMPGFIHAEEQTGRSLLLRVGILPSRSFRIDRLGRARTVAA